MKKFFALLMLVCAISLPAGTFAEEKMLLQPQDQPTMLPQTPEKETIHPKQPNIIFDILHGIAHILIFPFEVIGGILSGGK